VSALPQADTRRQIGTTSLMHAARMKLLFWRGRAKKKAFRARFRDALASRFPGTSYHAAGRLALRITGLPQWSTITLNLERAYREFCNRPDQFDAILERYTAALDPSDPANSLEAAAQCLRDAAPDRLIGGTHLSPASSHAPHHPPADVRGLAPVQSTDGTSEWRAACVLNSGVAHRAGYSTTGWRPPRPYRK
jgi:hypothetical protein